MGRFVNLTDREWEELSEEDSNRRQEVIEKQKKLVSTLKNICTDRQWEIVRRYFWEGQTQQEIADALSIKRSTVANTLSAIRRKGERFLQ